MNSYIKFKEKRQKEVNNFPMFFAFSTKQLDETLKKLSVNKEDILSFGSGSYIKKADRQAFYKMFDEHKKEFDEQLKSDEFVYDMFRYELANHEYCITYDVTDTLNALDLTLEQINADKRLFKLLTKAKKDYLKDVE
jgi:hypothetical protein